MIKQLLFILLPVLFLNAWNLKAEHVDIQCRPGELSDSLLVKGYYAEPDYGDGTAINTLKNITSLTITGTMDARDFRTIRSLLNIQTLNISLADIVAYQGTAGTYNPSVLVTNRNYDYSPKTIPIQAFQVKNQDMAQLKNILLPQNLVMIEYNAFQGSPIESIELPESLRIIEEDAFQGCSVLKTFLIPANVSSIGQIGDRISSLAILANCQSLETIQVAEGNTNYWAQDGVLFSKDGYLCQYPAGKTDKEYKIPEGTKVIAHDSFWNSKILESLTIPASVTRIENAFSGCNGLTKLICEGTTSPLIAAYGSTSRVLLFESIGRQITLFIPTGTASEYKKNNWGMEHFKEIIEEVPESITHKVQLPEMSYVDIHPKEGYDPLAVPDGEEFIFYVVPDESHQFWIITVKANGNILEEKVEGKYEIESVTEDIQITVEIKEPPLVEESITVNSSIGLQAMTKQELYYVKNLTVQGDIDAADFRIFWKCRQLDSLNLADATIKAFMGEALGTDYWEESYPEKELPDCAFQGTDIDGDGIGEGIPVSSIVLPRSLVSVGKKVFLNCRNLKTLVCYINEPPHCKTDAFTGTSLNNITLMVPASAIETYKAKAPWNKIGKIVSNGEGSEEIKYHSVTLPSLPHVTFVPLDSYDPGKIPAGGDFKFSIITDKKIIIRVNGSKSDPVDGVYTITNITTDQTVTVEIVATDITVNVSPGQLKDKLTTEELQNAIQLTITGSINTADFETLRTSFDKLTTLDLTEVSITSPLRAGSTLPKQAFSGNKILSTIILPKNLTSIEDEAFSGCVNLQELKVYSTVPPALGSDVFNNVSLSNTTLYVPEGSRTTYKNDESWGQFGTIDDGYTYYTVSIPDDIQNGTIELSPKQDEYVEGTNVTATAIPATGYSFLKWEDNITTVTRSFTIYDNVELPKALFSSSTGNETIQSEGIKVYVANKRIVIEQNNAYIKNIRLYHISGKLIYETQSSDALLSFTVPDNGFYILKINHLPAVKLNCN